MMPKMIKFLFYRFRELSLPIVEVSFRNYDMFESNSLATLAPRLYTGLHYRLGVLKTRMPELKHISLGILMFIRVDVHYIHL